MKRTTTLIIGLAMLAAACGDVDVGSAGPVTIRSNALTAVAGTTVSRTDTGPEVNLVPVTTVAGDVATGIPQQLVGVYFIGDDLQARAAVRPVDPAAPEAGSLRSLFEGPDEAEQARGLMTFIPEDTILLGLDITDGLATIDLSREFEIGGGITNILGRLAQVVYTVTQFPTVDEVAFRLDGEPITVFSGEGVVLADPVTRADYETALPLLTANVAADAESWSGEDLAAPPGREGTGTARVALIGGLEALPARLGPGPDSPMVGTVAHDAVVVLTGSREVVDGVDWEQIETPAGPLWVEAVFLAADVPDETFRADERVDDLIRRFARVIEDRGDLTGLMSGRGLWLTYNADPIHIAPDDLGGLLADTGTTRWPDALVSSDDPAFASIPETTFAEEIGDGFLKVLTAAGGELVPNEWLGATERGIPAEAVPIPVELRTFNSVAVHDQGANGIEWAVWYVSIDYEGGEPRIVGLTFDAWTP